MQIWKNNGAKVRSQQLSQIIWATKFESEA